VSRSGEIQVSLITAAENPFSATETVFREALGTKTWESFPAELQELFAEMSPAVVAEIRGRGLDLSEEPLKLGDEELAAIAQPTLIVSSQDSPDVLRLVNNRLAEARPHTEKVLVTGGHLINPAHPRVLDFVGRILSTRSEADTN
jgi:pimeloyl-ACP methyl ester carboxylesterase